MTFYPIFIPIRAKDPVPLWRFEGEWTAEDQAVIETVMYKHEYKHKKPIIPSKTWLFICRRFGHDADYHAFYKIDVSLYGDTAAELAQHIDTYYITGKTTPIVFESGARQQPQTEQSNELWLEQIKQLHERDKRNREPERLLENTDQTGRGRTPDLLRQSEALELLRQVQKVLLNGEGIIKVISQTEEYEQGIVLIWQGPISAARKPDKADEKFSYILVGVKAGRMWVNGKPVAEPTEAALKVGLFEACKAPKQGRAA